MRIFIWTFCLFIALASGQNVTTGGQVNGRFWRTLDRADKKWFLLAYEEGLAAGVSAWQAPPKEAHPILLSYLYPPGMTAEETMQLIDAIYFPPENSTVGIDKALEAAALKVHGRTREQVDDFLSRFRAGVAP